MRGKDTLPFEARWALSPITTAHTQLAGGTPWSAHTRCRWKPRTVYSQDRSFLPAGPPAGGVSLFQPQTKSQRPHQPPSGSVTPGSHVSAPGASEVGDPCPSTSRRPGGEASDEMRHTVSKEQSQEAPREGDSLAKQPPTLSRVSILHGWTSALLPRRWSRAVGTRRWPTLQGTNANLPLGRENESALRAPRVHGVVPSEQGAS